ncbi:MAG: MATE family efflux transporter [Oscillospiraceae bacterium]|nr:MATE family efflux transporter [Oscillospiraceae bacterium]
MDMTGGSITRQLISFAFPLLIGNLFQQLYNTVDTWVVGNFVSDNAFAAVGSMGPIVNMFIGFFLGFATGAGALISQNFGAKNEDAIEKLVHTAMVMTFVMGLIFTAAGHLLTPLLLDFAKIPEEVWPEAKTYLSIYFTGIMGLVFYNMGAAILRAVGDSKRPFYFLVVCAVLNTALDLLFVLVFGMKVDGVAWATILSQGVSAILIVISLMRTKSCVRFSFKKLKVNWHLLGRIVSLGIPSALQVSITSFSNIFVQSYINFFGPSCMSGYTAYSKIDMLLFLPAQSVSLATTTFVGQNLGCGQVKRARKGVTNSLLLATGVTGILMIPVLIFSGDVVRFFTAQEESIRYGTLFLRYITPFYLLTCFTQVYSAALRGAGNTRAPMVIMLSAYVLFRQVYLAIMSVVCNEVIPIAMGYPAGWILSCTIFMLYYYRTPLERHFKPVDNART